MKTNLFILYDEFSPEAVRLVAGAPAQSLDLVGIRFLSGVEQPDGDHLYVCTSEEAAACLSMAPLLHLAIVGDFAADVTLLHQGHSALIFHSGSSLSAVFNQLQAITEKYDAWDEAMASAILANGSLQSVLALGATELTNPIALFDRDFRLVMTAGEIPADIKGSIWEFVLSDSYSPPDILTPQQRSEVGSRLRTSDWPFTYRSEPLDETLLSSSLQVTGTYFGTFGLAEFAPFTQGQISLVANLTRRMEQALARTYGESGTTADMPYYINRLLSGYAIDEADIEYHLRYLGWHRGDEYQVLRIESANRASLSDEECAAFQNPIKAWLPDSLVFQYESGILVVLHATGSIQLPKRLIRDLDRFGLRAGLSMAVHDFLFIKQAYLQSKEAIRHGRGTLSLFDQCYTRSLLGALDQITSLKSYCHPAILLQWLKGDDRERQFILSVHAYLQNGRNLTDTAKKLKIHRNTLAYRIERVSDLIGLDLYSDTLDDDLLLMLNLSCQIVINLVETETDRPR